MRKRAQENFIGTLTQELQTVYNLSYLPEIQGLYQKYVKTQNGG
jgi:hypothetical protein